MKINFRIIVITFLLLIISFSHVYAIDLFLSDVANTIASEEKTTPKTNMTDNTPRNSTVSNPAPTVSYTSTSSTNTSLSISDIIDIILIAVCIVLIFLAIAILIRCK